MRRWTSPAPKQHGLCFQTAVPNSLSFVQSYQLAFIRRVPITQYIRRNTSVWQQSRCYTERSLLPSVSQQSLDSDGQPDLDSAGLSSEGFQDLLSEAARYSIHDVRALDFESSVNSIVGRNTRLVERRNYQFDYELWEILLRYRRRAYGDAGIRTVWNFLTQRDHLTLSQAHSPTDDSLWSIFVNLGLRDYEFLERIANHAKQLWRRRKTCRPSLYVETIGGLLKSDDSAAAPIFSEGMHPGSPITSKELVEVFLQACMSANPRALEHFRLICDSVANHKIYSDVIRILCEQERVVEAMAMHSYLIRCHDCPVRFEEIEPLVRRMAQNDLVLSTFTRQLEEAGLSFSGQVQKLYNSVKRSQFGMSHEDIHIATNRTFGVRRTQISDAFAARFFATKSFSFEFALNGLHMLGLDELGPLSLREISLQAGSAALVQQRLAKVHSMGIDTGGSAYSRVLRNLAKEKKDSLLMDVVHCDQHPDVFEDQQVQIDLLTRYHEAKDWRQLNRTLAIINTWGNINQYAPNGMLRNALIRQNWPEVTKIASQMHQGNSYISKANIFLMHRFILRPRSATRRVPVRTCGFQDLMYLITLWQNSLSSGTDIPSYAWREPLRRLGMMGRWTDLKKACLWLCSFYCPPEVASATDGSSANPTILPVGPSGGKYDHLSINDEIFSPALQRAIVEWGFVAGLRAPWVNRRLEASLFNKSMVRREAPWVCGIELLCSLKKRFGVRLYDEAIRAACQERLRQLFSRGGRSQLRHNREDRAMNRAKLHYYLGWINKVYGQALLDPHDRETLSIISMARWGRNRDKSKTRWSMFKPIRAVRNDASWQEHEIEDETYMDENDVVMYRDLFHASWEDYRPRTEN